MTTTSADRRVRVLGARDLAAVRAILDLDPVVDCFVASRVHAAGLDSWRLGGEMWGFEPDGRIESLAFAGANLVPVRTSAPARAAFAARARRVGRRCSSLVGPADQVLDLWSRLESAWGPARDVRECQPLMLIDEPPAVPEDPLVRRVRESELDILLPAAIAMFTEEVGVSPVSGGAASAYRARVADMVRAGRAFARIEDGRVVFKAEIGAATDRACQIQGVWVEPTLRGTGLSAPAMSAVVAEARRSIAPMVSLYVNDYNIPARRLYRRVGFADVGTFATVLI